MRSDSERPSDSEGGTGLCRSRRLCADYPGFVRAPSGQFDAGNSQKSRSAGFGFSEDRTITSEIAEVGYPSRSPDSVWALIMASIHW